MKRSPTDVLVIERHNCPKCGARRHEPCTYMSPPGYRGYAGTPRARATAARIGTEMISTHLERRQRYWTALNQRRHAMDLEEAKATVPPWLHPLREFDKAENEKMRAWLRANWTLFRLRQQ